VTEPPDLAFIFVHSPLVGPGTWERVADLASNRGQVAVPNLTGVAEALPPMWEAFIRGAVAGDDNVEGEVHIIGHSGAGAFLPEIGRRLGDRCASLIFVDAVVPPVTGVHTTSPKMMKFLDGLGDDLLPRWSQWWGPATMRELVPDRTVRRRLVAEMPLLPRSFYDEVIPVPDGWSDGPCGYVRLSAAYDEDYREAHRRGWPSRSLEGSHLSLVTESDRVFAAISSVVGELRGNRT
jgi:pimeloyl-ACP methyl ester carboxylesterase